MSRRSGIPIDVYKRQLLYLTRKNVIGKILAFASIAAISIPAFYLATSFIDVVAVRWNLICLLYTSQNAAFLYHWMADHLFYGWR